MTHSWLMGAAVCALSCAQSFAGPFGNPRSAGPSPILGIGTTDAVGILGRLGQAGRPPAIRQFDLGAWSLRLVGPVPVLSHTYTDMVVVRHGSELWIEPRG